MLKWLNEHNGEIASGTMVKKIDETVIRGATGLWSGDADQSSSPNTAVDTQRMYNNTSRVVGEDDRFEAGYYNRTKGMLANASLTAAASAVINKMEPPSLKRYPPVTLCDIPDRTRGVVMDTDYRNRRCLVQWDRCVSWWTITFDMLLLSAERNGDQSHDQLVDEEWTHNLSCVLCLMDSLLTGNQKEIISYAIELQWREVTVRTILHDFPAVELNRILRSQLTLKQMKDDQMLCIEALVDLGINKTLVEKAMAKVNSSSRSGGASLFLHCNSFSDILSKATLQLMSLSSHRKMDCDALKKGLSFYCTLIGVSHDVSTALVVRHTQYSSITKEGEELKEWFSLPHEPKKSFYESLYATALQHPPLLPTIFRCISTIVTTCISLHHRIVSPVKVLFQAIDVTGRGSISITSLLSFLNSIDVVVTRDTLSNLMILADLSQHISCSSGSSSSSSSITADISYVSFYQLITGIDLCKPISLPHATSKGDSITVDAGYRHVDEQLSQFRRIMLKKSNNLRKVQVGDEEEHHFDERLCYGVTFLLNQCMHLFKLDGAIGAGDEDSRYHLSLLLSTMESLEQVLVSTNRRGVAFLLSSISSKAVFIEMLIQLSLSVALLAVDNQDYHVHRKQPVKFKDLLSHDHLNKSSTQQSVATAKTSLLPIDFQRLRDGTIPSSLVEMLMNISLVASNVLILLLSRETVEEDSEQSMDHNGSNGLVDAVIPTIIISIFTSSFIGLTGLRWLISEYLLIDNTTTYTAGHSIDHRSIPSYLSRERLSGNRGTHLTLLLGLLDNKCDFMDVKARHRFTHSSCLLLCALIKCIPEMKPSYSNNNSTDGSNSSSSSSSSSSSIAITTTAIPSAFNGLSSNFADYVGTANIKEACLTLCELIATLDDQSLVKHSIVELILCLAAKQPSSLGIMFCASGAANNHQLTRSDSFETVNHITNTILENSMLVKTINTLLCSSEQLYDKNPQLLLALYKLISTLSQSKGCATILYVTKHLIQSKKLWDYVCVPLMLDLPTTTPDLSCSIQPFNPQCFTSNLTILEDSFSNNHGGGLLDASSQFDSFVLSTSNTSNAATSTTTTSSATIATTIASTIGYDKIDLKQPSAVVKYCHQLLVHAAALELLSMERYGVYYEIDSHLATHISKKMQSFFIKATECHRFLYWINHYMAMDVEVTCRPMMLQQANLLGLKTNDIIPIQTTPSVVRRMFSRTSSSSSSSSSSISSSSSSSISLSGDNYEFSNKSTVMHHLIDTCYHNALASNPILHTIDQVELYSLTKLKYLIIKHNLNTLLADTRLQLLSEWRKFSEFYVLPGLPAKQYQERLLAIDERSREQQLSVSAATAGGSITTTTSASTASTASTTAGGTASTVVTRSSSYSVEIGSLSPVSNNHSSASPLAMKKSAFEGDKRSYEVVGQLLNQLELHKDSLIMHSLVGRRAINEQCVLLVSMLHHQLKTVNIRTSDPSKSDVVTRELGSMRLTQDKMEILLGRISSCYSHLIYSPSSSHATNKQATTTTTTTTTSIHMVLHMHTSSSHDDTELLLWPWLHRDIALRLLTAMALLLNSIFTFNSIDELHSKKYELRRTIFEYAIVMINNLLAKEDIGIFGCGEGSQHHLNGDIGILGQSNVPPSNVSTSGRLSQTQSLVQVSLQLIKLIIPSISGSSTAMISITDTEAWYQLLSSKLGAISSGVTIITSLHHNNSNRSPLFLLIHILESLSSATDPLPLMDNAYDVRYLMKAIADRSHVSIRLQERSEASVTSKYSYEQLISLCSSLVSLLDSLSNIITSRIITTTQNNVVSISSIIHVLIRSPLLLHYQQVLSISSYDHDAVVVVAAAMGYSTRGPQDVSMAATCWVRSLNLIRSIIQMFPTDGSFSSFNSNPTESMLSLNESILIFIKTYSKLIILPLRQSSSLVPHRYSMQQLVLIQASLGFASTLNTYLPIWRLKIPDLFSEVSHQTMLLMRTFRCVIFYSSICHIHFHQLK
jgi:hypothetical protein